MTKLRVLFFPAWYPNPVNSIAGKFVKQHAYTINSDTDLAVFYVFQDESVESIYQFSHDFENGLFVFRVSCKKLKGKIYYPINALLYLYASFKGYFDTERIWGSADINHVHVLTRAALVPFYLKLRCKIPYVITEHWSRYLPARNSYKGFFRKRLTKQIVKESNGISSVSEGLKNALISHGLTHKSFPIIRNVVDSEKFFPSERKNEDGVFRFLHVSGMEDHVKNISGIIRAAKILKEKGASFCIDFVGHSDELPFYESKVKELGLQECLFFHGHIDEGLLDYFHRSDAFVLFSYFENQPVVLIEAFYCGIPVIASKAGGIPEMVSPENGLLVEVNNSEALAEAMFTVLTKQIKFDKEQIKKMAEEKYSYQSVKKQILAFYSSALNA